MDLLDIYRSKIVYFDGSQSEEGLNAVFQHIRISEEHFQSASTEGKDYLYTDVIYRCNQAYEGAMKEAYRVLSQTDPAKSALHKIEKYLEENRIVKERLLYHLSNYREKWRNPSAHDYRLQFTAQEALSAIASVSVFASTLVDVMTEKDAELKQAKSTKHESGKILSRIEDYKSSEFSYKIAQLLNEFIYQLRAEGVDFSRLTESELVGRIAGFLRGADDSIEIQVEPLINLDKRMMRPDLLLYLGEESAIIEVKRPSQEWRRRVRDAKEFVIQFAHDLELSAAFIFVPALSDGSHPVFQEQTISVKDHSFNLGVFTPSNHFSSLTKRRES